VREDTRFKIVATPNLSALSGAVATLNSGAQVPTVSSVSIAEGGTPVQSIEYRDSGIILTVRPVVRGELIELEVKEERSSFVRTTTGVSDTPTLQKSAATASVVLKSGESVVLAGLTEESDERRSEGLLGGLLGSKSRNGLQSELLVILTAELVAPADVPGGVWIELGGVAASSPDAKSLSEDAKS
jgi:type II secretory pathway component GspD/PulD (secretin)